MTTKGAEKSRWSSKSFHIYKPGQIVVGRYRVMRVIAAGGQAEVYEVVDSECMEYRALKTPDMRNCESPAMVERMVREFKAFSNVQHRGLVRMYDAGVDQDDQFYIVMELIDGPTLRDLINRHRRFPTGVALSLMNQIARAVHVLHATGCIHRDLKPENILVRELPDEAAHRAVVIDLGIARFIGQSTTSNGVSMGTVTYMAPEQTQDKRVDARADVYAICLMLYEMLAGKHALSGDCAPGTRDEWAARQRDFEPKPLDELGLGVHPLLSNLVKRGLSKKAAQRFDSAADLANHIEAIKDALQHIGQLGPERFEDFLPTEREVNESGPQPIARVRPAGVETPSQGLPYRRTAEVEVAPVEPVRVSPEPPRVVVHPDKLAARGTQRMLGRMGTVPNLDAMRAGRAAQPQPVPPAPPPPAPVETAKVPP
ncbi:MAG: serine/threonine protein kinase, partial [Polyangiaceae bacterium]|nr:serine/threonine protein kinase [Polyangiaceae bacterium]